MSLKTKRARRRSSARPPASGCKPTYRFSARDVMMTADELQTFHREFHTLLQRREQQRWSLLYLCGQLSNLERSITVDTAMRLARYFGTSPAVWLRLQVRYDLEAAEPKLSGRIKRDVKVLHRSAVPPSTKAG
jgi:hypothetical protein